MDRNTKKKEDDAGDDVFVIVRMDLSSVHKIDKAIWYILGVEVTWGDLLTKFMGCSEINDGGIHDGTLMEYFKVADEVLGTLER